MASGHTPPFSRFEWMLASRYMRARSRKGSISVIAVFSFIGIALGVSVLIIAMSVMNGFHEQLFGKILGLNGHLIVRAPDRDFTDFDDVATRIRAVPSVRRVFPVVESQVLVSSATTSSVIQVRGLREADLKSIDPVSTKIFFGTLDGFDAGAGIAIGTRLAGNMLNVRLGDEITVMSPRGAVTPFGTAPRTKTYPVTAIFETGMAEYDQAIAFIPFAEAQKFFNVPGGANSLQVLTDDPDAMDMIGPQVIEAAGQGVDVADWRKLNATFHTALQVEQSAMFVILSLIILVAALNIISGLIMLVKDKGRDVAILRTMGASQGAVMRVFFVAGASIGIAGTVVGVVCGVTFCANAEHIRAFLAWMSTTWFFPSIFDFLSRLPSKMTSGDVAFVVVTALSLSVLATLYPSWRAARLDPVQALRYE